MQTFTYLYNLCIHTASLLDMPKPPRVILHVVSNKYIKQNTTANNFYEARSNLTFGRNFSKPKYDKAC